MFLNQNISARTKRQLVNIGFLKLKVNTNILIYVNL